jgi:hypothetical protein
MNRSTAGFEQRRRAVTEWIPYVAGAVLGLLGVAGSLVEHVQFRRTTEAIMRSVTTEDGIDVQIRSIRGLTIRIRTGGGAGSATDQQ